MSVKSRGDTIVEVIVAFTIFAMATVAAIAIMNRGIAMSQRSLETTLVRQQVDSQADMLRFVRDNNSPAWNQAVSRAQNPSDLQASTRSACPADVSQLPPGSFYLSPMTNSVDLIVLRGGTASSYQPADTYARVDYDRSPSRSHGLWIQPIRVAGTGNAYDMYINACWDTVGSEMPITLRTIVRLYES